MMGECNLDGLVCVECRRDGSHIAQQIVQQKDGYLKSCISRWSSLRKIGRLMLQRKEQLEHLLSTNTSILDIRCLIFQLILFSSLLIAVSF
jgi:hypothetical protein